MTRRSPVNTTLRRRSLGLFAMLIAYASIGTADPKTGLVLFTPQEAAKLRVSGAEWKPAPRMRSGGPGPRIEVRAPALKVADDGPLIETSTPANLSLLFQANGSPVDMSTLEVTARKGIFSKSLTDMLKPYVHGTALEVKDVSIPSGKFLIEIAIADQAGAKTVATYRLQVDE